MEIIEGARSAAGGKNWVVDIQDKIKDVNSMIESELWNKQSIYRIPVCIKDLNRHAYSPQVISFGPYHHGEGHLKPMEEHKRRSLLHFLKRADKPFNEFVESMEEVVRRLMDSYEGLDEEWRDKDRFLQLMIVDGCFMLEILRAATGNSNDYAYNDPIFSSHGLLYTMGYIKRDMLMMENQLPLMVLEKLVGVETGKFKKQNDDYINRLVVKFCSPNERYPHTDLGLHPLDVCRKGMLQGPTSKSAERPEHSSNEIVRSAIELHEAGIRFKRSRTNSLKDIQFKHGVLSLPVVVVDDMTESMLLNFMAFERLHVSAGNEVTSYVFFMDNIIDSAKDVSLLHSKGIIQNAVGSDKAVANLFNSLSKDVTLDPESALNQVHRRVNSYCGKRWNMWRANLIHTYFRSPWAVLSLVAAVVLLALAVIQTVYTILPFYSDKNNSPPPPPPPPFLLAPPPSLSPR